MSKKAKYSRSFMHEVERFCRIANLEPSEHPEAIRQFWEYESKGIEPSGDRSVFDKILAGKSMWEWQLNDIANKWGTDDWCGWWRLQVDFVNDLPGLSQIVQRVEGVKRRGPLVVAK